MRDYARVLTLFWSAGSGKALRDDDEARLLALYLFTNEHGNMLGLFSIAVPTMLHELGPQWDEARFFAVLERLSAHDVAHYDREAELMYLPAGARTQIDDELRVGDKRIKGIVKQLRRYAGHRFHGAFVERYRAPFRLPIDPPAPAKEPIARSPLQAPSKPLRSPADTPSKPEAETEAETEAGSGARAREPNHHDPILFELQSHPALAHIDHAGAAETIRGLQLANGRPIAWHVHAIRRTADKALGAELAGKPWDPGSIGSYLVQACRNPSKPSDDQAAKPSRPGPPPLPPAKSVEFPDQAGGAHPLDALLESMPSPEPGTTLDAARAKATRSA